MFFDSFVSKKEWNVYELTNYLKKKVESDILLKNIYLKGEVIRPILSGDHLYFELKDLEYDAKIKCVYFWYDQNWQIKHGSKVLLKGNVIFYEKEGIIELKVNEITDIGLGELYTKLRQLEEKLKKEGLFDQKYKQMIPRYPKKVGIVTSKNGAAVLDILNTIYSRFENIEVYIFNCSVQGQNAPYEICEGIDYFNKRFPVEVIIVGRGGGSFEDLMAFNDEMVVRKIFESRVPIISAVGHERDFVLSDYVADLRAITPTKAGEIIVSFQNEAIRTLNDYMKKIKSSIRSIIDSHKKQYEFILYKLYQNSPSNMIAKLAQDIDIKNKKISLLIHKKLNLIGANLRLLEQRLKNASPFLFYSENKNNFNILTKRLEVAMKKIMETKTFQYKLALEKLITLNPLNIIKRGYSVTFYNSKVLKSIEDVKVDDEIITFLSDGIIKSKVFEVKGNENDDRAK